LFPALSENSDEGAYLAQADALAHGRLGLPAPAGLVDALQPWLAAARGGTFFFKYAPPHAALIAVSQRAFGTPRLALAVIAGAAVVAVAALALAVGANRREAILAATLLVASPVFLVQASTYLPYIESAALGAGGAALALMGLRRRSQPATAAAGALLGLLAWSRPFDALLVAIPLMAFGAVECGRRGMGVFRWILSLAAGALPCLLGILAYDAVSTGSALRLTFQLLDRSDTLGFGARRLQGGGPFFHYSMSAAFDALIENARLVVVWAAGGLLVVVLAGVGFLQWRDRVARWYLLGTLVTWFAGYWFFWGAYTYVLAWDGGEFLGPFYFVPAVLVLVVLAARGLAVVLHKGRIPALVTMLVMVALTALPLSDAVTSNLRRTAKRESVRSALSPASAGTLNFIPPVWGAYLQHPFSFWRNRANSSDAAYALEGIDDVAAAAHYPGRTLRRLILPDGYPPGDTTTAVAAVVETLTRHRASAVVLVQAPRQAGGRLTVVLGNHAARVEAGPSTRVLLTPLPGSVQVSVMNADTDASNTATTVDGPPHGVLSLHLIDESGHGDDTKIAYAVARDRVTALVPSSRSRAGSRPVTPVRWQVERGGRR
jgi:hypothetical protein